MFVGRDPVRGVKAMGYAKGFWLAQLVSLTRALAAIAFFISGLTCECAGVALALYLYAVGSDYLDGLIAKLSSSATKLGASIDLFADKVLTIISVMYALGSGVVPWPCALIVMREVALMVIRSRQFPSQKELLPPIRIVGIIGVTIVRVSVGLLLVFQMQSRGGAMLGLINALFWLAAGISVGVFTYRIFIARKDFMSIILEASRRSRYVG